MLRIGFASNGISSTKVPSVLTVIIPLISVPLAKHSGPYLPSLAGRLNPWYRPIFGMQGD